MTSLLKQTLAKISPYTKHFVKRQGEFALKVNELLDETGMTQRELAEKLGKKESYVSRVLSGWANPTFKTMTALEVALGIELIDFHLKLKIQKFVGIQYQKNPWENVSQNPCGIKMPDVVLSSEKNAIEWKVDECSKAA